MPVSPTSPEVNLTQQIGADISDYNRSTKTQKVIEVAAAALLVLAACLTGSGLIIAGSAIGASLLGYHAYYIEPLDAKDTRKEVIEELSKKKLGELLAQYSMKQIIGFDLLNNGKTKEEMVPIYQALKDGITNKSFTKEEKERNALLALSPSTTKSGKKPQDQEMVQPIIRQPAAQNSNISDESSKQDGDSQIEEKVDSDSETDSSGNDSDSGLGSDYSLVGSQGNRSSEENNEDLMREVDDTQGNPSIAAVADSQQKVSATLAVVLPGIDQDGPQEDSTTPADGLPRSGQDAPPLEVEAQSKPQKSYKRVIGISKGKKPTPTRLEKLTRSERKKLNKKLKRKSRRKLAKERKAAKDLGSVKKGTEVVNV